MSLRLVPLDWTGAVGAPPGPPFACSWSWSHGGCSAAIVRVSGELDIATAPRLEQTLHESLLLARRVVVDLHELEFIDSAGVHAIVNASIRARQDGRRLVLARVPPGVHRVVTLTGNSDHVEIGTDAVGPSREALHPSHRRGARFRSTGARLRAAADPGWIENESYDRLVRAIVDHGSPAERGPFISDPEDSRPR